jgi:3'(2'), 5'-bisphosphate nucleotidase
MQAWAGLRWAFRLCRETGESPIFAGCTAIHRTLEPAKDVKPTAMNVSKAKIRASEQEITPDRAERLLDALTEIVARAAAATLAVPLSEVAKDIKTDLSPVTSADTDSEAVILKGLAHLLPGIPVVSEESVGPGPIRLGPSVVIVDPLDGTKEFLAGRDEFTVNIGIVTRGVAIAGLIAAPAQGLLWRGIVGSGAERLRLEWGPLTVHARSAIRTRPAPERLVVATSRSHLDASTEDFLARLPLAERYPCGSSVKFCHVAQGNADVYPRLSPTHEWDIAAGCAILAAAGGAVTDPQGKPLRFGQPQAKFLVPGFIAWGDPAKAAANRPQG